MSEYLDEALLALRKKSLRDQKQALVFSGHSNLAAGRSLVDILKILAAKNATEVIGSKLRAVCTVFEAAGGLWFDDLPDGPHLALLCHVKIDDKSDKITHFKTENISPGSWYCPSPYEFPLAYLLLGSENPDNLIELSNPHFLHVSKILKGNALNARLQKLISALEALGVTDKEISEIFAAFKRAFSQTEGTVVKLSPFDGSKDWWLNQQRRSYFKVLNSILSFVNRAFMEPKRNMKHQQISLICCPFVPTAHQDPALREFFNQYVADRLQIHSYFLQIQKEIGGKEIELSEGSTCPGGILRFLDESLMAYRPVKNNYVKWIEDAAKAVDFELFRTFHHFNGRVSYKSSDFTKFGDENYSRHEIESFNNFETQIWSMDKARFYYFHCQNHLQSVKRRKRVLKFLNVFCDSKHCLFCTQFANLRAIVSSITEKESDFVDKNAEVELLVEGFLSKDLSLNNVWFRLCEHYDRNLSHTEDTFVEIHYIAILLERWLNEAVAACRLPTVVEMVKIVEQFDAFQSFGEKHFPHAVKNLKSTHLLNSHRHLVSRKDVVVTINVFKERVLIHYIGLAEHLQKEFKFLAALVNFLRNQKSIQEVSGRLHLKDYIEQRQSNIRGIHDRIMAAKDFYESEQTFNEMVDRMESLKDTEFQSMVKLRKILVTYTKEINFIPSSTEPDVLAVHGMSVQLSLCLSEMEKHIKSGVKEVRIICGDVLHLDCSLEGDLWRGINLVVMAKLVKVWDKQKIVISGKDSAEKFSGDAGRNSHGEGLDGDDGYPGQSGGNIFIQAEEYENAGHLQIESNGGKGSDAQKGGDGDKGKDGEAMGKDRLLKYYDTNVHSGAQECDPWKAMENECKKWTKSWTTNLIGIYFDQYIKGTCADKLVMEYNYDNWCLLNKSNFFISYGTNGTEGKSAGVGGLGGDGGFAGELETNCKDFQVNLQQGCEGQPGKDGVPGLPGKNGYDIGYHDHESWNAAKYCGFGFNRKLKVGIRNGRGYGSTWSREYNSYVGVDETAMAPVHHVNLDQRQNTRRRTNKKAHANATRNKAIDRNRMETRYAHILKTANELMADLNASQRLADEMLERARNSLALNKLQEDDIDVDVNVNENIGRQAHHEKKTREVYETVKCTSKDVEEPSELEDGLIDVDSLFSLRTIQLNRKQIEDLSEFVQSVKRNDDTSLFGTADDFSLIENTLLEKQSTMKMQSLEKTVSDFVNATEVSLTDTEDFLEVCSDTYKDQQVFKFIFRESEENRKLVTTMLMDLIQKNEADVIQNVCCVIKAMLFTLNKTSGDSDSKLRGAAVSLQAFEDEQKLNVKQLFSIFMKELAKDSGCKKSWEAYQQKKISKLNFCEEISKHSRVNDAFTKFEAEMDIKFNFSLLLSDKEFKKALETYVDSLKSNDLLYLHLLSCLFNVSIEVYEETDSGYQLVKEFNEGPEKILVLAGSPNSPLKPNLAFQRVANKRKLKSLLMHKLFCSSYSQDIENVQLPTESQAIEKLLLLKDEILGCNCKKNDIDVVNEAFAKSYYHQEIMEFLSLISSNVFEELCFHHLLARRILSEPVTLSDEEFVFTLQNICESLSLDTGEVYTLQWMVAVAPMAEWTAIITKINLENFFKTHLNDEQEISSTLAHIKGKDALLLFNNYLSNRNYSSGLTQDTVKSIFQLLSKMRDGDIDICKLELSSWPYALRNNYWKIKLKAFEIQVGLDAALNYVISLENTYGTEIVESMFSALQSKNAHGKQVFDVLDSFYSNKWTLEQWVIDILSSFEMTEWSSILDKDKTDSEADRRIDELCRIVKNNKNTSDSIISNVDFIMESVELANSTQSHRFDDLTQAELYNAAIACTLLPLESVYDDNMRLISVVDRGIQLKKGFKLRDTQKLAIMSILCNEKNTLLQVSTGEGKSLIVVTLAIIKALRGQSVDIITSSSVLAKRDADGMREIFSLYNISVSHNCQGKVEERRAAYSQNQVIYGDISNFQRDYLLDRFYGKNVLGNRSFDCVIIDEVDSMLLDKGNNMLYLSHEMAGIDKLQSLYIFIWKWINRPIQTIEDLERNCNTDLLKEAVFHDMYGTILSKNLELLSDKIKEEEAKKLWKELVAAKVISDQGRVLVNKDFAGITMDTISQEFHHLIPRITFMLNTVHSRKKQIIVPKRFFSFIELHLDSWLQSAINAYLMVEKQDYVVDVDRSGSQLGQNIIILDRDTGTDMANSQWDEALHQFLQLKHGCKLTSQTLKAVYISNVSYLKRYKHLYGLTGTLGSKPERELLNEIHKVEFMTVPNNKRTLFDKYAALLCIDRDQWVAEIVKEAKEMISQGRSVLVVCETVEDVNILHKAMGGRSSVNVQTYTREFEESELMAGKKELETMKVLISTNLAGRGTDIILSEKLRDNGGLHVCLAYLPSNARVEEQAFGRAARAGDRGSGRIICMNEDADSDCVDVYSLINKRNGSELRRLAEIKTFYSTQIRVEEKCFEMFSDFYNDMQRKSYKALACELAGKPANFFKKFKEKFDALGSLLEEKFVDEKKRVDVIVNTVKNILLKIYLDNWAFWLDENAKMIPELKDEGDEKAFFKKLHDSINLMRNADYMTMVKKSPSSAIILGKYLIELNSSEKAEGLFDCVVNEDHDFSAFARFYKAVVVAKHENLTKKAGRKIIKKLLNVAEKMMVEKTSQIHLEAGYISSTREVEASSIVYVNAFQDQQSSRKLVHEVFIKNMSDIFGHQVFEDSFKSDKFSRKYVPELVKKLRNEGYLTKTRISRNLDQTRLEEICSSFGIFSPSDLRQILDIFPNSFEEKEFIKELKKLRLASRELFWDSLKDGGALKEETTVVTFTLTDLNSFDENLQGKVDNHLKKTELKEFNSAHEKYGTDDNVIAQLYDFEDLLSPKEDCNDKVEDSHTVTRDSLARAIGEQLTVQLEEIGILTVNKFAIFDAEKAKTMNFKDHDTLDDRLFNKFGIEPAEQTQILEYLVQEKVLQTIDKPYKLGESDLSSLPPFQVYKHAVTAILTKSFAFRLALLGMLANAEANEKPKIRLHSCPEKSLFFVLLEANVIKPPKVTSKELKLGNITNLVDQVVPVQLTRRDLPTNLLGMSVEALQELFGEKSNDVSEFVHSVLKDSQSVLYKYEHPDPNLQNVTELLDNENNFDRSVLRQGELNGEDRVITWEEKKWTRKMIWNALAVAFIGIVQIAIGIAIHFWTAGALSQLGSAFISEGVSDITYSLGCLMSGHFSWADYAKHKLISCAFTALTFGVAAAFSWGSNVSFFGEKLAMPGMQGASTLTGTALFREFGKWTVCKQIGKQFVKKLAEGVWVGFFNRAVDKIIDTIFRPFMKMISRFIRKVSETVLFEHTVNITLRRLHEMYGAAKASQIVEKVTAQYFTAVNIAKQFITYFKRIFDSIETGLKKALDKTTGNAYLKVFTNFCTKVTKFHDIIYRTGISTVCVGFYAHVETALAKNLKNGKPKKEEDARGASAEEFCNSTVRSWRSQLDAQLEDMIESHVVSPMVHKYGDKVMRAVGRKMKNYYEAYKVKGQNKKFEQIKEEYREAQETLVHIPLGDRDEKRAEMRSRYEKRMKELLSETRDPDLFLKIIKEKVPMEGVCVQTCAALLQRVLNKTVCLNVDGEGYCLRAGTNDGEVQIPLSVEDGHFLDDNEPGEQVRNRDDNSCLIRAIFKKCPELRDHMTEQEFRQKMHDEFSTNQELQDLVRKGLHRHPLRRGLYAGAKKAKENQLNPEEDALFPAESGTPYNFHQGRDRDERNLSRSLNALEAERQRNLQKRQGKDEDEIINSKKPGLPEDPVERINTLMKQHEKKLRHLNNVNLATGQNVAFDLAFDRVENACKELGIPYDRDQLKESVRKSLDPTMYDVITLEEGRDMNKVPGFYPTEMNVNISLYGERRKNKKTGDWESTVHNLNLHLDLDNPHEANNGPREAHIGYNVTPVNAPSSNVVHVNKPDGKCVFEHATADATKSKLFYDGSADFANRNQRDQHKIERNPGHVFINRNEYWPDRGRSFTVTELKKNPDPEFFVEKRIVPPTKIFMTPVNNTALVQRFPEVNHRDPETPVIKSSKLTKDQLRKLRGRYPNIKWDRHAY